MTRLSAGLLTLAFLTASAGNQILAAEPDAKGQKPADEKKQVRTDRYGDPLPEGAIARLGSERLRHGGTVTHVAFSPNGKILASTGQDWLIRLWDPASGKEVRRLGGGVQAMALSANGALVAAACKDRPAPPRQPGDKEDNVHLWEAATGKAIPWPAKHGKYVNNLVFSHDGKILATVERDGIHLWEVPAGKKLRQLQGEQKVPLWMAFSPDGKWLLSGGKDKSICLWEVASGKTVHLIRTNSSVWAVAFAPDGKTFAVAGGDGLGIWNTSTGKSIQRFEGHDGYVAAVAFAPDGKTLVSGGSDRTVRLWDVAKGREGQRLIGSLADVQAVAFSPDGKQVASGGRDQCVRLWDVKTGREVHLAEGHKSIVWAMAFSPDGKTLVTGAGDCVVCLWDVARRKMLRRLEGHTGPIVALTFSPDGKTLASAGDRSARLWETATGKKLRQLDLEYPAASLAFSPDGKTLAAGGHNPGRGERPFDSPVQLWDLTTGKTIRTLWWERSIPYRVFFSPGGETLVAASNGKTVHAWSVRSGTKLCQLQSSESFNFCVAVSADGRNLAGQAADGTTVYVWELATGKERARFKQELGVLALDFSPDGERLIGALNTWPNVPESQPLCVWDLVTGRETGQLPGHSLWTRSLASSPDGKTLASGGSDGTVLLWDADRMPKSKRPIPRELSAKELDVEWQALTGEDAARAYRAVWTLRAVPNQALPLLRRDLRPLTEADLRRITKLVEDLDSNQFAVREKAKAALEKLGQVAEPALSKALENRPSAELRKRASRLLQMGGLAAGDRLRAVRMLELVERIGTPEASRLLKEFVENRTDPWLAREARESLERLAKRRTPKP
jgi:WD40 repeat protein